MNINLINNIGVMNNYTNKFIKNKNTNLNNEHNASTIKYEYYPSFKGDVQLTFVTWLMEGTEGKTKCAAESNICGPYDKLLTEMI